MRPAAGCPVLPALAHPDLHVGDVDLVLHQALAIRPINLVVLCGPIDGFPR